MPPIHCVSARQNWMPCGSDAGDGKMDAPVVAEIHEAIATSPIRAEITDLHVWRVGKGQYASIVSLAVDKDIDVEPEYFRRQIGIHEELVHITVEVNQRERP